MTNIQLTLVREKSGNRIRCIYLGDLRVFGAKPYVSENLPHEFFQIEARDLEAVLATSRPSKAPSDEP